MTVRRAPSGRQSGSRAAPGAGKRGGRTRYWSAAVNQSSDALDLESRVFVQRSARAVAASLKLSAERSRRRKSAPYQSAMSMLNFYINRAGHKLTPARRRTLERAKSELRVLFGRDRPGSMKDVSVR